MTGDSRLRSLERALLAFPHDLAARDRLEAERLRAGLGWHGERLPDRLARQTFYPLTHERGVYGFAPWNSGDGAPIEMVYVPGGSVECTALGTHGHGSGAFCGACNGTGRRKLAPFYLGRFPVTREQWGAFLNTSDPSLFRSLGRMLGMDEVAADRVWRDWNEPAPWHKHHPAVNLSHANALAFCEWAGLRLPTSEEWTHAALGLRHRCYACDTPLADCRDGDCCERAGKINERPGCVHDAFDRRYPWGNEPPTPERCVWADWHRVDVANDVHTRATTEPVTVDGKPARPQGASWCGAMDCCGNVWEWTKDHAPGDDGMALVCGGSFRSDTSALVESLRQPLGTYNAGDDVGFRVALSTS